MTLKEHMYVAKQIRKIRKKIMGCYDHKNGKCFRKISIPEMDRLNDVVWAIDMMKSTLDDSYHRLITNEQFERFGHIYYDDEDNPYHVTSKRKR